MHLVDAANGVLGATGVVAGNLALAAGAAWAAQAQGRKDISVVFFGDGATGAGAFHETLNLAALWRLPVLFVCENNGYAEFTSREEHSNVKHVSSFAAPYDIATQTIDGNDLPTVSCGRACGDRDPAPWRWPLSARVHDLSHGGALRRRHRSSIDPRKSSRRFVRNVPSSG